MQKPVSFLLIFLLLISPALQAEPVQFRMASKPTTVQPHVHDSNCRHGHEIEIDENSDPKEVAAAFINEVHELSHDHRKGTIQQYVAKWIDSFRLIRHSREKLRWKDYRSFTHPEFNNHVWNSVFLFLISHPIEGLSGPALAAIGASLGWDVATINAILGGGLIITIPGLDPLCYVLIGSYKFSTKFQKFVTVLRLQTVNLSGKLLGWKSGEQILLDEATQEGAEPRPVTFFSGGIRLVYEVQKETMFLGEVHLEGDSIESDFAVLKDSLDPNSRQLVKILMKWQASDRQPFYIEAVQESAAGRHFLLKEAAIQPWGKISWRDCLAFLRPKPSQVDQK